MKSILTVIFVLLAVYVFSVGTSSHKNEVVTTVFKRLQNASPSPKPAFSPIAPTEPKITASNPAQTPATVSTPSPTPTQEVFPKEAYFPDQAHLLKPTTLTGSVGSGSVTVTLSPQTLVWVFVSDDHKTVTIQNQNLKGAVPIEDTDFVVLARANQSKKEAERIAKEKAFQEEVAKTDVSVESHNDPQLVNCMVTFKAPLPRPAVIDQIIKNKLQEEIDKNPDKAILCTAFLGDDTLEYRKQYSGSLAYDPKTKTICNEDEKMHSGVPLATVTPNPNADPYGDKPNFYDAGFSKKVPSSVESYLKQKMRDPSSFQIREIGGMQKTELHGIKCYEIQFTVAGKNGFGGFTLQTVNAWVRNGALLQINVQ